MTRRPIHVHPTAPLADRVLLPGDPGRALLLAQELLDEPKMFNHNRGLWGYTGQAADGEPMTIQSTGMGGPSAAIVLEELIDLGASRVVRVGTCGALNGELRLGDLVVGAEALAADGASRALGASGRVPADPDLTARLAGDATGAIVSSDLFYDPRDHDWAAEGVLAVEMEAAVLFTIARRRGIAAACVCVVSDLVADADARLGDEELEAACKRMGRAAQNALVSASG